MSTTGYVRKDRRDSVTRQVVQGPTHRKDEHGYTLCGVRMKGFTVHTSEPEDARMCTACEKHHAAGTRGAWKGGR